MKVPHEITLIAFARNPDGSMSILDIVETSFRFASRFWSRMSRDSNVAAIRACKPGIVTLGRTIIMKAALPVVRS
jgi:hypothetical protein